MMDNNKNFYNGNENLPAPGRKIQWTREMIDEFKKCQADPLRFIEHFKITTIDEGEKNLEAYDYQKEIIKSYVSNYRILVNASRQSGKCVTFDTRITIQKNDGIVLEVNGEEFLKMVLKDDYKVDQAHQFRLDELVKYCEANFESIE